MPEYIMDKPDRTYCCYDFENYKNDLQEWLNLFTYCPFCGKKLIKLYLIDIIYAQ